MTPQQKALIAELQAADYPATWMLSASAADDKLVASGARSRRQRTLPLELTTCLWPAAPDRDVSARSRWN
jgi:hypothetical protein